ncbi:MAG: ABC transporter substrate-binding protein [Candidatus Hodarchaeales archaeon]|jgi:NitT/TauT family transport system substrate-binding protein
MKKWNVCALIVVLFFFTVFSGCLTNDSPSTNRRDKELTTVKVAMLPFISYAPFIIGNEEGYFEEEGIEVEFVKLSQSSMLMPALAEGSIDVGAGGVTSSLFNSITRGMNIKIVADKGNLQADCDYSAILVRKDLFDKGEITEISQLKGHKLGLSHLSSWGHLYSEILNRGKLNFDDVEIITPLTSSQRMESLETRVIDATVLNEPYVTRATDFGLAEKLVGVGEVLPDFQLLHIMYGQNLLEKDPELGKRFMVANLKSVRQYNEGKTDRNIKIIQEYTDLERDIIERSCWPHFYSDGHLNVESVLKIQEWGHDNGYVDELLTEDQLFDLSFIEYANEILS